MKEGWVDYVAPQLYWPTTREAQAFGKLVAWWATLAEGGRSVFVGHDATKIGEPDWPLAEYAEQMKLSRAERPRGVRGSIFFSAKPLVEDTQGLRSSLAMTYFAAPAATPRLAAAPAGAPEPPAVALADGGIEVTLPASVRARAIAVYRDGGALDRLVPAEAFSGPTKVTLGAGRFAITTVDRAGRESVGMVVEVP